MSTSHLVAIVLLPFALLALVWFIYACDEATAGRPGPLAWTIGVPFATGWVVALVVLMMRLMSP